MADTEKEPDLDTAYGLDGPDANKALYRAWAASYDADFVAASGYRLARRVAEKFVEAGGQGPVLDVGCGTGQVADFLPASMVVDGLDLSPDMLKVAGGKGRYRTLFERDVTLDLDLPRASYAGWVSAGTFTHGHVGPVCLPELVRIARPGALFALTVNAEVYDAEGFGSAFARLVAHDRITPLNFRHVRYYEGVDHEHAEDTGLLALFRKR